MTDQQTQTDSIVFTKKELWINQAPCLNFQYDEDQLLKLALRRKFVTQIGEDQYLVNPNY
jgi:hypothetical protein